MQASDIAHLTESIKPYLREVEALFHEELHSDLANVNELVGYVSKFRGKMLRPILVMLCGGAAGGITPAHVTIATVVEMVHMATLVHDDVLDEAELRRGGSTPACRQGRSLHQSHEISPPRRVTPSRR